MGWALADNKYPFQRYKIQLEVWSYLELPLELTLLDVSEFFLDPGLERCGEEGQVNTGDMELEK